MRKNIFFILLLAKFAVCQAAGRTDAEMMNIAKCKLSASANVKGKAQSANSSVKLIKSESTYSIYASGSNGFVIVSRDDRFIPILGYSTSKFNIDDLPCCFKWWLDKTAENMEAAIKSGNTYSPYSAKSYTPIAPILTTKWHQSSPFNMYAPIIKVEGVDKQTPAGCVAVAMAQIINYNRYPESASFEGEYYTSSSSTAVTANVNSVYSYPYQDAYGYYFPDGYTSQDDMLHQSYGPSQAKAIAALVRDCAYSVGMIYNINGSGAYSEKVPASLINCFQYPEETVKLYDRTFYSDSEWMEKIHDELYRGYPIMYSGNNKEYGGHAFVVHGMDTDGLAYVNWGWQGMYDGYYAMDLMNAGNKYQYSENQSIVTNIHPYALSTDAVESLMVTYSPYKFSYNNDNHELTITFTEAVFNYSPLTLKGRFCLVIENISENSVQYEDLIDEETMEEGIPSFYGFKAQSLSDVLDFNSGNNYRLYIASKDNRETDWQPLRTVGGPIKYNLNVSTSGTVTVEDEPIYTNIYNVKTLKQDTKQKYYTIDGKQTDNSTKGLVIVKQGNMVKKVIK